MNIWRRGTGILENWEPFPFRARVQTQGSSPIKSFAQAFIQPVHLAHGPVVRRICRNDTNLVGVMLNPVQDCLSQRSVVSAELVVPAAVVALRAK